MAVEFWMFLQNQRSKIDPTKSALQNRYRFKTNAVFDDILTASFR